jgi:hypothetical protein
VGPFANDIGTRVVEGRYQIGQVVATVKVVVIHLGDVMT